MRLCILVLLVTLTAAAQNKFKPNANPFNNFGSFTDFDSKCVEQSGDASSNTGSFAQDVVKNNFAAPLPAKDITVADLAALQQDISRHQGFPFGRDQEPKTRDTFHQMKGKFQEGQAVRLTAYILRGKTSDTTTGESVNCNIGFEPKSKTVVAEQDAPKFNDIHIALVGTKTETAECQSVTAEISPHFRPASWTEDLFKTTAKGKLVRLTGQLMYDASHTVCKNGTAGNGQPSRQSGWEVHPVYQVEICTQDDGQGHCTGTFVTADHFKPARAASQPKQSKKKSGQKNS